MHIQIQRYLIPVLFLIITIAVSTCQRVPTEVAPSERLGTATPLPTSIPILPTPSLMTRLPPQGDQAFTIHLQSRQFLPEAGIEQGLSLVHQAPRDRVHMILQLFGPPSPADKRRLEAAGIGLLNYIPRNAWFASVPRNIDKSDPALELIRWIGPIMPEDKLSPDLLAGRIGQWAIRDEGRVAVEISFFEDVDLVVARQVVAALNGTVISETPLSNKLIVEILEEDLGLLAAEDSVRWIDQIPPPPVKETEEEQRWDSKTCRWCWSC